MSAASKNKYTLLKIDNLIITMSVMERQITESF